LFFFHFFSQAVGILENVFSRVSGDSNLAQVIGAGMLSEYLQVLYLHEYYVFVLSIFVIISPASCLVPRSTLSCLPPSPLRTCNPHLTSPLPSMPFHSIFSFHTLHLISNHRLWTTKSPSESSDSRSSPQWVVETN